MHLLEPITMGPYRLRSRIVMAPLTRSRAAARSVPTELMALHYRQRSSAGLIVSEAAQVSWQGVGYADTPGVHTDEQIRGWKLVTDAVHSGGGRIFCQLFHCGRISHVDLQQDGAQPVAPSAIRANARTYTRKGTHPVSTPRALGIHEIPVVAEQFRHAAKCAQDAGFDGVEIHGANGYLLDQFLRDGSNDRTDRYGGSIANRIRLLLEVTETVTSVWTSDRVGVHLSPVSTFNDMHDSDPEGLFTHAARELNRFGLAYLHVVEFDGASPDNVDPALRASARKLRTAFNGAYIANGGYSFDPHEAEAAIVSGDADLVSFGRLFISNPDLPRRVAENAPMQKWDSSTFYGGDERGYTDYPFLEEEQ